MSPSILKTGLTERRLSLNLLLDWGACASDGDLLVAEEIGCEMGRPWIGKTTWDFIANMVILTMLLQSSLRAFTEILTLSRFCLIVEVTKLMLYI
jgi:hypothetical protein